MFYFQELSRKIVYSIKVSILLIFCIGLCSLNTESAYAYNIFQLFSNNSVFRVDVRADSIIRIDKGFVAHLYEYQDAQSSNISHESELLNAGLEQLERENFKDAIISFTKSLQFNPNFALQSNKYEQAISDYDRVLKGKSDDYIIWTRKAIALYNSNKYKEADYSWNKALEHNPDSDYVWYIKARMYGLKPDLSLAIKNLEKAITLNSEYKEKAKADDSFDLIREEPSFQALIF